MSEFPQIFRLRQRFASPKLGDVAAEVSKQLGSLQLKQLVRPGESVAVTVGSRGIASIALIVITRAIRS